MDRLLGLAGSILLDAGLLYTGFSICHFLDWALMGFSACTFSMGQINFRFCIITIFHLSNGEKRVDRERSKERSDSLCIVSLFRFSPVS